MCAESVIFPGIHPSIVRRCKSVAFGGTDILMITYNRPEYSRRALTRLLQTCHETTRVWLWHNGDHGETLDLVRQFADHPRVHEFHHSKENRKLRDPTNWLWENAKGDYLSKVDDDCLMPSGWLDTLRTVHQDVPQLGVISCWHFPPEDFAPEIAYRKIQELPGGHRIMRNCWVGGSGYMMKRTLMKDLGPLRRTESFTDWCNRAASRGHINGWYFPFLYMDHMDDPRSEHCRYQNEDDFCRDRGLTAVNHGISSLADLTAACKREAIYLQTAPWDPRLHTGWRHWVKRRGTRLAQLWHSR
jgi:glycosyltransferase involved in cell wall biosynthesis